MDERVAGHREEALGWCKEVAGQREKEGRETEEKVVELEQAIDK